MTIPNEDIRVMLKECAKAAEVTSMYVEENFGRGYLVPGRLWNPTEYFLDATRLAMKLGLRVDFQRGCVDYEIPVPGMPEIIAFLFEEFNAGNESECCLAICRAAQAIYRSRQG